MSLFKDFIQSKKSNIRMNKTIAVLIAVFISLFFTTSSLQAAPSDQEIEARIGSNPQFERVYNNSNYQYVAASYLNATIPSATNVESFYKTLENSYRHILGAPTYVPIAVGDITTIIPIYSKYKNVGDGFVQSRYIRSQINEMLGRNLIDSSLSEYQNETAQLNALYRNTIDYIITNPSLVFGQKLAAQDASDLTKDIIWPELRIINGEQVVVPIVYLTAGTVDARKVTDHTVYFGGLTNFNQLIVDDVHIEFGRSAFLDVANNLLLNQGALTSPGDLKIVVGGTLQNASGLIQTTGDLHIGAHNIASQTIIHRYDFGNEHGTRYGEIASFNALTGDLVLRSYSDILLEGTQIYSGGDITFAADGSIYIGGQLVQSSSSGNEAGWRKQRSNVDYLQSTLTAEDAITLIANSEIVIDAAEIVSDQGHIELLAGLGITIDSDLSESQTYQRGKFGKKKKEISTYQTVAIRALLDAGKDIRLHTEFGDITLKSANISSIEGTTVEAKNGAVNLLMTVETDHYNYSSVKKSLFTTKTTNRGHDIETGVHNTIVGGFAVEALNGVKVEYEGNPDLTLDEQIAELAQFPGLEWMANVKANTPDVDWAAIELQYNTWNKTKRSISPAFAAVISIAVAIYTGVDTTTWFQAAINAGTVSLASQAAVALANGIANGDIGQVHEDLASSETFKNIAVAMVTAGALAKIDADFFKVPSDTADSILYNDAGALSLVGQAAEATVHTATSAAISTVLNGGDMGEFRDAFGQALLIHATNKLGEKVANEIGRLADFNPPKIGEALRYISHAALGCALGTATAKIDDSVTESNLACTSGAVGAVIGEAIAQGYTEEMMTEEQKEVVDWMKSKGVFSEDEFKALTPAEQKGYIKLVSTFKVSPAELQALKQKGVDLAKLGAGLSAFVGGVDVNLAARTAENAAENNWFQLVAVAARVIVYLYTAAEIYEITKEAVAAYDRYVAETDPAKKDQILVDLATELAIDVSIDVAAGVTGAKLLEVIVTKAKEKGLDTKITQVLDDFHENQTTGKPFEHSDSVDLRLGNNTKQHTHSNTGDDYFDGAGGDSTSPALIDYSPTGSYVNQGGDPICGPTCCCMIINDVSGSNVDLSTVVGQFDEIRPTGVNINEMSAVLTGNSVKNTPTLYMTPEVLNSSLNLGNPVIVGVPTGSGGHFLIVDAVQVVDGVKYYLTRDPLAGPRGVRADYLDNAISRNGNAIILE